MSDQAYNKTSFEQVFGDAENALRRGLLALGEWGEQARTILEERPGVIVASVSIAGFMTGLLLRQNGFKREDVKTRLTSDPIVAFMTGALVGLTLGPRILKDASARARGIPDRGLASDFGPH
ncbi:MAG: hypothetical protein P4M08_04075 [Oligoflexia bacterium]|nr:hypothetical protein [Oligoflexia bacterium]